MNKTFKMMPLNMEAEITLQLLGITEERFDELIEDVTKGKEMQPTSDAIEQAFKICNNANELAAMMFVIGEAIGSNPNTHTQKIKMENKLFEMKLPLNEKAKNIHGVFGITEKRIDEIGEKIFEDGAMTAKKCMTKAIQVCDNANELAAVMCIIGGMR